MSDGKTKRGGKRDLPPLDPFGHYVDIDMKFPDPPDTLKIHPDLKNMLERQKAIDESK